MCIVYGLNYLDSNTSIQFRKSVVQHLTFLQKQRCRMRASWA